MKNLITEARELCEDVTPGQWRRHDTADYAEIHNGDTWGKDLSPIALVGHTDDANFIARSRTLIPELCDALQEAGIRRKTFQRPVRISFWWNSALDLDNEAYMRKMIIDSLHSWLIENDSKRYVKELRDYCHDEPYILVEVREVK